MPVDSRNTLGVKKFIEMALSCSVFKINAFLRADTLVSTRSFPGENLNFNI